MWAPKLGTLKVWNVWSEMANELASRVRFGIWLGAYCVMHW